MKETSLRCILKSNTRTDDFSTTCTRSAVFLECDFGVEGGAVLSQDAVVSESLERVNVQVVEGFGGSGEEQREARQKRRKK